jgi:hypothetical protein
LNRVTRILTAPELLLDAAADEHGRPKRSGRHRQHGAVARVERTIVPPFAARACLVRTDPVLQRFLGGAL